MEISNAEAGTRTRNHMFDLRSDEIHQADQCHYHWSGDQCFPWPPREPITTKQDTGQPQRVWLAQSQNGPIEPRDLSGEFVDCAREKKVQAHRGHHVISVEAESLTRESRY
jgi:hypothetical protein